MLRMAVVQHLEVGCSKAVNGVAVAIGHDDVGQNDAACGVQGQCRCFVGWRLLRRSLRGGLLGGGDQNKRAEERETERRSKRACVHSRVV